MFTSKELMFTSNFSIPPTLKTVQISKVSTNFCANFKSWKQALLKVSFGAVPHILSQKKYFQNFKQLKNYIFGYHNIW